MKKSMKLSFLAALLLSFFMAGAAHAVLNDVGPTNPTNGFPVWYQDTFGVALEQCNFSAASPDPFCIPAGAAGVPIPNIDFEEAFWWAGEASAPDQGNVSETLLVLALEAAFGTGEPVAGQQTPFARIRIRIDVAAPGIYTVTHPYGVNVYNVTTTGTRAINDTLDVIGGAGDFTALLDGPIGPFLRCVNPAPPAGYLGNFNIPCTFTGSPFGTNYFRIQGPGTDTITNQFAISGKIFTGVLPTPLVVERATYARSATGQVDVFALSSPLATVNVTGGNNLPAGNLPMTGDAFGNFFLSAFLADPSVLPALVNVSASMPGNSLTQIAAPLVDSVDVTSAVFDMNTSTLSIAAASSDQTGAPALTATGFGPLVMVGNAGTLSVPLEVPPAEVTVNSAKGGVGVRDVSVISVPTFMLSGFARTATGSPIAGVSMALTGAANRTAITGSDGSYSFAMLKNGAYTITPTKPQVLFDPLTISASIADANLTGQNFTGTILNGPPSITSTAPVSALVGQLYTYDVNATDPDADTLTYSLFTSPAGMTINATTGLITWTPTTAQIGANSVTVRATDPGGLFAAQSFTVTVQNRTPVITSTPVTSAPIGQLYSYDVNATDPDGQTLTYSLFTSPAGMTINATTGLISWTPTAGQVGAHGVIVRATDPGGLFAAQSFTVTVAPADTLTVSRVQFSTRGNVWRIEGASSPAPTQPRTVTIYLGATVGGTIIGVANVASDGDWSFNQNNSPVVPTTGQRISVLSSSGGKLENIGILLGR